MATIEKNLPTISYLTNKVHNKTERYEIADEKARKKIEELESNIGNTADASDSKKSQAASNGGFITLETKGTTSDVLFVRVLDGIENINPETDKIVLLRKKAKNTRMSSSGKYRTVSKWAYRRFFGKDNKNPKVLDYTLDTKTGGIFIKKQVLTDFFLYEKGQLDKEESLDTNDNISLGDGKTKHVLFELDEGHFLAMFYNFYAIAIERNGKRISNLVEFRFGSVQFTHGGQWFDDHQTMPNPRYFSDIS